MLQEERELKLEDISVICKSLIYESNITWKIQKWCNYKCSYCLQTKEKPEEQQVDKHTMIGVARKINEILQSGHYNDARLILVGGEISFLPLKVALHQITSNNLKCIEMTTNFSNDEKVYIDLIKSILRSGRRLIFTASLHDEHVDYKEFLDKAARVNEEVLKHCSKYKNNLTFRVEYVIASYNVSYCKDVIEYACKKGIEITTDINRFEIDVLKDLDLAKVPKSGVTHVTFKDGEVRRIFKDDLFRINYATADNGTNVGFYAKDWYCSVLKNEITIEWDCSIRLGASRCSQKRISLFDFDPSKISDYIKCSNKDGICGFCGSMVLARTKEELDLWYKKRADKKAKG